MALTTSGLYVVAVQNALKNTIALDLTNAAARIALYTAAVAPNFSTDTAYSATAEVSGTGWAAGGPTLATAAVGGTSTVPTVAEGTVRSVRWDMGDVNVATTTLTNVSAAIVYADYLAPKQPIIAILFAGGPYSTNAGTFSIVWANTGLAEIALGGN